MYPIKNIQCICICISIRVWAFDLCSRRAASASAERPSLLIPSLLRDREFLALAPPGSQHSPSRDFFEEVYIVQGKLGCVGRFNVQGEAFVRGWSRWQSPRLVVFHEGDETMKECHEFEDERVHFGFVCMVKRLQIDEAVLDSSLLPEKLVSAIKNENTVKLIEEVAKRERRRRKPFRLLTRCLPTLQPIQILGVLCVGQQKKQNLFK